MVAVAALTPSEVRELLAVATPAELAELEELMALEVRRLDEEHQLEQLNLEQEGRLAEIEGDWRMWLTSMLPGHFPGPFARHHEQMWNWTWALRLGVRPAKQLVAIIGRGGAKSTTAEASVVAVGARRTRRYVLYVSGTQDLADEHVANIGEMLESPSIEAAYPELASRDVSKYGSSKGWRRNRLRTASGFIVDAAGLDTAVRGRKQGVGEESVRPDLIVVDDIDHDEDSADQVRKKINRLSKNILPGEAFGGSLAVLAIQNLIHPNSVFAQLADGRAEFLHNRIVIGPVPAVQDLQTVQRAGRTVIVGGTPSWEGQNLEICQAQIDDWGFTAFKAEAQHDVEPPPGGMFDHIDFPRIRVAAIEVPPIERVAVWVDPAVTDTKSSDSQAIQADGLGVDGRIYRLRSWEQRSSPLVALTKAVVWAVELGAVDVGVETDQGGDTWESVFREAVEEALEQLPRHDHKEAARRLGFKQDKASKQSGQPSKAARVSRMLADYERDRFRHVEGLHDVLERSLRRFPLTKPHDLADAAYWAWDDLAEGGDVETHRYSGRGGLAARR